MVRLLTVVITWFGILKVCRSSMNTFFVFYSFVVATISVQSRKDNLVKEMNAPI